MKKLFNPIKDKTAEIIEYLMSSPDMPTDDDLRFKLRLSIEETVENVVQYAYKDGIGWMEVGTALEKNGFRNAVIEAITAACNRSIELGK